MIRFLVALLVVTVLASTSTAGPLRDRFTAPRGNSCTTGSCAPTAAVATPAAKPAAVEAAGPVGRNRPVVNAIRGLWWLLHPGWFRNGQ